jgi:hypothetical protein
VWLGHNNIEVESSSTKESTKTARKQQRRRRRCWQRKWLWRKFVIIDDNRIVVTQQRWQ